MKHLIIATFVFDDSTINSTIRTVQFDILSLDLRLRDHAFIEYSSSKNTRSYKKRSFTFENDLEVTIAPPMNFTDCLVASGTNPQSHFYTH